jgi:excisionase family DNA binding protein
LKANKIDGFGYCDFHEEPVNAGAYEYKGCWGCYHFHKGKDFTYMSVVEASKEMGVSENTIRRWIKKGIEKKLGNKVLGIHRKIL